MQQQFMPKLIFWETTNRCNLSCMHCRASAIKGMSPEELTTQEMKNFIDNVASFARPILVLSGGEPLVRPDIFEVASYAVSKGLKVALATNGTLVRKETALKIKSSGVMRVSISIDGERAETHDKFRGEKGAFSASLSGLRSLKKLGIGVQINTTVSRQNVSELPKIYELAIREGAEAFHVFMLVPVGCGLQLKDSDMLAPEKYEEVLHWLYERSLEEKIEIKPTCAPHYYRIIRQKGVKTHSRGCLAGTSVCFVSYRGDVQPCGYLPLSAGSIRNQGFKEIWGSAQLFEKLRDPSLLKGKCGSCEYRVVCEGCRARAYAETRDFLAEEPYCIYEPKKEVAYG